MVQTVPYHLVTIPSTENKQAIKQWHLLLNVSLPLLVTCLVHPHMQQASTFENHSCLCTTTKKCLPILVCRLSKILWNNHIKGFSDIFFIVNSRLTLPYIRYKKNLFRRCPWSAHSPPPTPSGLGSLMISEHLWCLACICSHQFCEENSGHRLEYVHSENLKDFTLFIWFIWDFLKNWDQITAIK